MSNRKFLKAFLLHREAFLKSAFYKDRLAIHSTASAAPSGSSAFTQACEAEQSGQNSTTSATLTSSASASLSASSVISATSAASSSSTHSHTSATAGSTPSA